MLADVHPIRISRWAMINDVYDRFVCDDGDPQSVEFDTTVSVVGLDWVARNCTPLRSSKPRNQDEIMKVHDVNTAVDALSDSPWPSVVLLKPSVSLANTNNLEVS